ncbi:hypothetical protein [Hymenobacter sp. UYP22]|uniref:hypothetical protein n=1 Tax=Hymenobacter sp. UYP22 TaxID=3156348 RepID=UPI00339595E0
MAEYTVTPDSSHYFRLAEGLRAVGELTYPSWFTFDATLSLLDQPPFQIKPKGFWGTTIELEQHGNTLLHFTVGWNGNILLHAAFPQQPQQNFIFKQKGVFKNQYMLTDDQDRELLVIQPGFKWKNSTFDFTLFSTERFEALASKDILMLVAVHCANYYLTLMMSTTFIAAT